MLTFPVAERWCFRVTFCWLITLLAACASLPENFTRESSFKLDARHTFLARAFAEKETAHPGLSGAYPLNQGMEALAARVVLARAAEKSLDVQYYIWHNDDAGRLLLKELLDAADRGVRVRLLLDDLGAGQADDQAFIQLDSHPNLSVSLFNPIASRNARTLGLVSDPLRLNRRMHNKSMTADNTLTVVGGRNIGNEYFSLDESVNFADLDVLAIGPVADQVSSSFDAFWNSASAFPISAFHSQATSPEEYQQARLKLDQRVTEHGSTYYAAMRSTSLGLELQARELSFYWGNIVALYDVPEKVLPADDSAVLLKQLGNVLGKAQNDVLILSPYFVPGKEGTAALIAAVERGARVRIVTNSLASTDVAAVHAGYKKSRRALLEGGVELFEMMPQPGVDAASASKFSFNGSSAASLHAKTFVVDHQRVFIGSMNLDPRSVHINTEIGLLIDNAELAQQMLDRLDANLARTCFRAVLEASNPDKPGGRKHLLWLEQRSDDTVRYTKEPQTSFWQRLGVSMISLLPVDSQL